MKTILIIDDDISLRETVSGYLEKQGYNVITAENGVAGCEMIERHQPDAMLVDLRMPEMDGIEVLKVSRESAPDTPKIVISGVNRIDDVIKSLRHGAWDYLEKPLNSLSILNHTIEKALEKARLIKENKAYQKNLKNLVKERTHELEQANRNLSNINHRLKNIVETTKGLSGCIEMNSFSTQILDEFSYHMLATGGSLYLVERNGLKRMHSLDPGHAPDFIEFPLPERSVVRRVFETGEPLLIEDLSAAPKVESSGWNGYKDGSLLAFPIPDSTGKVAGIITLHSKKQPPFVEQDKEIGAILASYSCETLRAVLVFQALQKSEKLYRTLFEKTNDAIFIIEKKSGRYLDANTAAQTLSGQRLDELKQQAIQDILAGNFNFNINFPADINETIDLGIVNYPRDGQPDRIARLSIVPLDEKTAIAIARDITQDLEVEKQLRQSQKMEAICTLAGGIAHDFNNILAGIFGYAQLADMDIENPEKAKKNIEQILAGAQRARGLVQQILTFSRQSDYQKKPLKLYLVVKEALKFLRSSIPSSVQIEENISSDSLVMADSTQAHQIVMNLCTNAYHAMRDAGGVLEVELKDVEIHPGDNPSAHNGLPGKYVRLEVKDTGHGMSKETLNKIFNPYFTTKQPDKGTGLGLAVVDGIIKEHNGFINVCSHPGQGTTFQVFLPVIEAGRKPEGKLISGKDLSRGSGRIMLVDDEVGILDTTKIILERIGYEISPFSDPRLALKEFMAHPARFDLVITDIAMPKMTGDKLAAELLRIRPDAPILICTGFSESITEEKALEMGISGLLYKPVVMRELVDKIQDVMDTKSAL